MPYYLCMSYGFRITKRNGKSSVHINPHRKCQYARGIADGMYGAKERGEQFETLVEARAWWLENEPKKYERCTICFYWGELGPNPADEKDEPRVIKIWVEGGEARIWGIENAAVGEVGSVFPGDEWEVTLHPSGVRISVEVPSGRPETLV